MEEPVGFKSATAQRNSWRIQRTAWVILWAVLLLALAGGLGSGPLSHTTVRSADQRLEVGYHRIWRVNNPELLEVRLSPDSGRATLELDDQLFSRVSLDGVTPAPSETLVGPGTQRLVFTISGGAPAQVRLELVPRRMGRLHARIARGDGPPLTLTVWVLP